MYFHIDTQVKKNCWNFMDSYGEICVHCECCSNDKKTRQKARLECLKRWLKEREEFNNWTYEYPDLLELQKKNVASDIKYYKKRIRYYEKQLEKE